MLANERSVALQTPDARLTWLCHPGPDAPAVFADLLGGEGAGHFSINPHRYGLPLGQRLSHADNRHQAGVEGSVGLPVYRRIGLAEVP